MQKKIALLLFISLIVINLYSQQKSIVWHEAAPWSAPVFPLSFSNAVNADEYGDLPVYAEELPIDGKEYTIACKLTNTRYIPATDFDGIPEDILNLIDTVIVPVTKIVITRNIPSAKMYFLPVRKNLNTQKIEVLVSFQTEFDIQPLLQSTLKQSVSIATKSKLSEGDWYKIRISETGVYKITYNDLVSYGINPESVDPRTISLHGFSGGMLPEKNNELVYDDLPQITIMVNGEEDGIFNQDDYILFYGQGPHEWKTDVSKQKLSHKTNLYNDYTWYYLTTGTQNTIRIGNQNPTVLSPSHTVTTYRKGLVHELEIQQMTKSGKQWYGETFDQQPEQSFSFHFTDIDTSYKINAEIVVVSRSSDSNWFKLSYKSDTLLTLPMAGMSGDQMGKIYARSATESVQFKVDNEDITLGLTYNLPNSTAKGILDYLEVNAVCKLLFRGGQLIYDYIPKQQGSGNTPEIILGQAGENVTIWNVTDRMNVLKLLTQPKNGGLTFKMQTAVGQTFVAFDGTTFLTPEFVTKAPNQNLHALQPADYIIIAPHEFLSQAEELAQLHQTKSGLSSLVVPLLPIYEEFSAGAQDPVAIRAFIRMLYLRAEAGREPKYILLYGDGSYDPKNRLPSNTNIIPVFESKEALSFTDSYPCDDFYGLMDAEEGEDAAGAIDIGIGRLPVTTPEEATAALNKIKQYLENNTITLGPWRNQICLIADDEDSNTHFDQAEDLAYIIDTAYQKFNVNKLYLDAFKQINTATGTRYPEVNKLLAGAVNSGSLMVNYTGHGGELGWAGESILTIPEIHKWTNTSRYPVFVTATCEFSRFDDPGRVSAGEHVFLTENDGGIALFTTTRLAYSHSNAFLNQSFYKTLFKPLNGGYPRLGDLVRISKNLSNNSTKIKNFVLLGDPALNIAFPQHNIAVTHINGIPVASYTDTLKAYSVAEISGEILNNATSTVFQDFNGELFYTVYDKTRILRTLANDPKSKAWPFNSLGNILSTGKTNVKNGKFTFTIIVPKDIDYSYGNGKISLYASDSLSDASGEFTSFTLGGMDNTVAIDEQGPEISLYLDDKRFESGNQTSRNPVMYLGLADSSGINYLSIGIGHDIVASLDNDNATSINLNARFEPVSESNKKGSILYPFSNLPVGNHTLTVKAWDLRNNSSEKTISFYVSDFSSFTIKQVYNSPNPFTDRTWFVMQHDMPGEEIDIAVEIYTMQGFRVKTLTAHALTSGYSVPPVEWDGRADNGQLLATGIYVYTITVSNQKGVNTSQKQKLMLMR